MGCILTLLVFGAIVIDLATSQNALITNGTCYYYDGKLADDVYTPCGNAALGHLSCCQLGDACYTQNVCVTVDKGSPITYLASCTDINYEDVHCPRKGNYEDYQWIGLAKCPMNNNVIPWTACDNNHSSIVGRSDESEGCDCDLEHEDPVLLAMGELVVSGTLPATKGQSIDWEAGMAPTATGTALSSSTDKSITSTRTLTPATSRSGTIDSTTTSTSSKEISASTSTTTSTITTSSAVPAATSTAAVPHAGISNGAVAGTAVGSFIGLCGAILACIFAARWYRKRHSRGVEDPHTSIEKPPLDQEPTIPEVGVPDARSSTWSGDKPELPGSPAHSQNYTMTSASPTITSPNSSMPPSPGRQQQVYKPFRYQPNTNIEGIQELPDDERPQWAQTGWGTYGPYRDLSRENSEIRASYVHELQGTPIDPHAR